MTEIRWSFHLYSIVFNVYKSYDAKTKKKPSEKLRFIYYYFLFFFVLFRQHRPSVSESSEHSSQAELTMEFSISPAPPSSIPTTNQNSSQFDQEISVNSPQSQNQTEPTKIGPYMSNDIAAENAADAPWRGILRKTESKINLNE